MNNKRIPLTECEKLQIIVLYYRMVLLRTVQWQSWWSSTFPIWLIGHPNHQIWAQSNKSGHWSRTIYKVVLLPTKMSCSWRFKPNGIISTQKWFIDFGNHIGPDAGFALILVASGPIWPLEGSAQSSWHISHKNWQWVNNTIFQ